jgi:hypothetical protein
MKLKLYFSALRRPDQTLGKLFRRHGRIEVLDHLPFRREQVRIGGMSDFHPMEFLPALLPECDHRTGRVRSGFRSGDDFGFGGGECCCGGRRRVPDLMDIMVLMRGSVIFPCRDQGVPGYVAATCPKLWYSGTVV